MLVDYRLGPGIDGLQTIARLRRTFGASVPAALVSGESAQDDLARIQASGIPLLHKPVRPARLRSLLVHLLRPGASHPATQVA
jgi:CheY-like chemotaxis protein